MDSINKQSLSPGTLDPEQHQPEPAHQDLPANAGFAGHSVNVGAGSANMPAPPPYSRHDPLRPDYACPPPAYTPVACTPGLTVRDSDIPATLKNCLFSLDQAYHTDFTELADTLSGFRERRAVNCLFPWIFREVLDPELLAKESSNRNLQHLAQSMRSLVRAEYDFVKRQSNLVLPLQQPYSKLSQLTVVICMNFLEQRIKSEYQESRQKSPDDKAKSGEALKDCEQLLPAVVRKTFIQKLLSAAEHSGRWDAKKAINTFVNNNESGLKEDMDFEYPVSGNLNFSKLLYQDIPGATISKKYIPQLEAYGRQYNIDLSSLVEALGQTQCRSIYIDDPLVTVMKEVAKKSHNRKLLPVNFFDDQTEPFRNRNARCLLELMNYCQNQVFRPDSNTPSRYAGEPVGESNDTSGPLQESSADNQRNIQAVTDKLSELLLTSSTGLVHSRLTAFFQIKQ
ncbi:hypothetical protein [Endozoicomonas sp. SCSIO W0465]|uniref:hypothetical protein n=1 Tax=Endozoicomonas sp. SCSIO W0465 TaxID=2918516 RepID=UPI002075BC68|nr:hypothetical protein [Endozoicomonas sp. SCSIO W0465]USE33890.1 hypothetical protein MJO57_17100 [Endozoicomonas sp. SCSIO W0465]